MKHILIVDDDIHINKMLDEVLVHERYMVSHAYSGTEALLFLADTKPDLILLDLMLPGLSGEELLPQISDIPIIVRRKWRKHSSRNGKSKIFRRNKTRNCAIHL